MHQLGCKIFSAWSISSQVFLISKWLKFIHCRSQWVNISATATRSLTALEHSRESYKRYDRCSNKAEVKISPTASEEQTHWNRCLNVCKECKLRVMIERSEFWLTRARLIECTAICQSQCCWTAPDSGQQVIGHAYDQSVNTFVYDVYRFTDSSKNIKTCCKAS